MSDDNGVRPEDTLVPNPGEEETEFRPWDEVAEDYKPSELRTVRGEDGLPTFVKEERSDIPPLTRDTLICMGDFRSFVVRDEKGNILEQYKPTEVSQHPNGDWFVEEDGQQRQVEPVRPPCRHYVVQSTQFEANPKNISHLRLCSARRTTEGAFMSVRDLAMWACTMREPRDLQSEQIMTRFDELKIKQGEKREFFSLFRKE